MQNKNLKPGQAAPHSGQYQEIGPRGGKGIEKTIIKNKPMPPSSHPGSTYKLVDARLLNGFSRKPIKMNFYTRVTLTFLYLILLMGCL